MTKTLLSERFYDEPVTYVVAGILSLAFGPLVREGAWLKITLDLSVVVQFYQ